MPDTPEDAPTQPPLARRVKAAPKRPPAPRTGWWWVALALTALMVLVLTVTVAVSVSAAVAANARATATTARSSPPPTDWATPGVGGPGQTIDFDEAQDTEKVKAFFAKFAVAVGTPNGPPDELFDWSEMTAAVPDDALDPPPGPDGQPRESNWHGRQVVQSELSQWRRWDWAKANVRKVNRRPDNAAVEAIVWHPVRDGKTVFRRWTFTDSPDGLQLLGWEDLRTGITSRDRAYSRAASSLSPNVRKQRQWQFADVTQVHQHIDRRNWEEAKATLDRLKTVRFDGDLQYAVDLAEARYALTHRQFDADDWDQDLAVEILEDVVAKHPERLAAYPLLAEAHLLGEEHLRAIEVCDAYLAVTGDDPDLLTLRGSARAALILTDDAAADFTAALALDRHQPRAVNWQRQQANAAGKKAVAEALATAPDAPALFDSLVEWATRDEDWPAVLALAERYRTLRPKDARWLHPQVEALLHEGKATDALTLMKTALPTVPPADRPPLVTRLTQTLIGFNQAEKVYAAVPSVDAPAAFAVLAQHFEILRGRWANGAVAKEPQEAATKALTELIAAHRKAHPDDPKLALHEGRLLLDSKQYQKAADLLAPAVAKHPFTGDATKDWQSGYHPLLIELVVARYKSGQAVEAYRELKPQPDVFLQLADLIITDKDADGLTRLLDERKKVGGETPDELYWRAETDRIGQRYADAARKYSDYLTNASDEARYVWAARPYLVRCLIRAGDLAAAEKQVKDWPGDMAPNTLRAVLLVKSGKPADAERLLRDQLAPKGWAGHLYTDDDLGPILKGDPAFAVFRKDFPPPDDKPKSPR